MKLQLAIGAAALLVLTTAAFAGAPANPGVFGRDRAECVQTCNLDGGAGPGHSWWGHLASDRGSTNGDQNQAYKDANGGTPTHGND